MNRHVTLLQRYSLRRIGLKLFSLAAMVVLLAATLGACGAKGDLFLPDEAVEKVNKQKEKKKHKEQAAEPQAPPAEETPTDVTPAEETPTEATPTEATPTQPQTEPVETQ